MHSNSVSLDHASWGVKVTSWSRSIEVVYEKTTAADETGRAVAGDTVAVIAEKVGRSVAVN